MSAAAPLRDRRRRRSRRAWRLVAIGAAVLAVLGGGAAVWIATSSFARPEAAHIDAATGAITLGEGERVVATYLDPTCVVCGQFEQQYGPLIAEAVEAGEAAREVYPVALRRDDGDGSSTRTANAVYCVAIADRDATVPYLQKLFDNQPPVGDAPLTDENLVAAAGLVGVTGVDDCIAEGTYARFVAHVTDRMPRTDGAEADVPTLAVDGAVRPVTGDPARDLSGIAP